MAGNSKRRGAKGGSSSRTASSGGRGRKRLEGRGPTPKAEDRVYHKAHKAKLEKQGRAASNAGRHRTPVSADYVTGRNSVLEALRQGVPATGMFVAEGLEGDARVREIMRLAAGRRLTVEERTRPQLDRLTDHAIHQGVALRIPPYEYASPDDLLGIARERFERPLLIALDGVTDPRNLGAILRSAGAFGAHGVIIPERRSVGMTATAWKVAAGAAGRVRVAQVTNLNRTLTDLKREGLFVAGLDAAGDVASRASTLGTEPIVLVIGSEGRGLSRLVRESCDEIVSIPVAAETESLNASVACAIALYDVAALRAQAGQGIG